MLKICVIFSVYQASKCDFGNPNLGTFFTSIGDMAVMASMDWCIGCFPAVVLHHCGKHTCNDPHGLPYPLVLTTEYHTWITLNLEISPWRVCSMLVYPPHYMAWSPPTRCVYSWDQRLLSTAQWRHSDDVGSRTNGICTSEIVNNKKNVRFGL